MTHILQTSTEHKTASSNSISTQQGHFTITPLILMKLGTLKDLNDMIILAKFEPLTPNGSQDIKI